jgi:hypothetical protein
LQMQMSKIERLKSSAVPTPEPSLWDILADRVEENPNFGVACQALGTAVFDRRILSLRIGEIARKYHPDLPQPSNWPQHLKTLKEFYKIANSLCGLLRTQSRQELRDLFRTPTGCSTSQIEMLSFFLGEAVTAAPAKIKIAQRYCPKGRGGPRHERSARRLWIDRALQLYADLGGDGDPWLFVEAVRKCQGVKQGVPKNTIRSILKRGAIKA